MARLEFASDYMEGCIPEILTRLTETNLEKSSGYGSDEHTARAAELIREACDAPDAEVHLLAGGTQTNRTVIGAMLKPWEGVIAAQTGHISVHEAGAIESLGHKVFELPQRDGKLRARDVEAAFHKYIVDGNRDHMPAPALVYISHPTETGTLYTRAELEAVTGVAHRYGARVFLDGARLAYGLGATKTDLTLADIARTCDAFYIGGTKCGALFGEAVVFPKPNTCPRFFTWMKQQGALLAKGRITGLQFETLMEENRYVEYGAKAVRLAEKLREGLKEKGYQLLFNSTTNQTFVKLPDDKYQTLSEKVGMSFWEKPDDNHTIVRLATSWATTEEDVDALLEGAGKGMTPTEAGLLLQVRARQIVNLDNAVRHELESAGKGLAGMVRIGCVETNAAHALARWLRSSIREPKSRSTLPTATTSRPISMRARSTPQCRSPARRPSPPACSKAFP